MRKEIGSSALSTLSPPIIALVFVGSFVLPSFNLSRGQAYAASPITPSGLNTQVTLSATPPPGKVQYDITGGTRPGGGTNLFHSFGDFNVPNNNIANFLNDSGLATSNILGRVTGGNISNIFGTIQTTGFGSANLFLMNPAGFLFGPNATVNVGGMVAFTTADYLRLADGARFNAIPNAAGDALLSAAPVAAFGFLGSNPGAITVQGSQLSVTPGQSISLVGGNITVQSGVLDDGITIQPARLSAPGGQINLASVASPGEVLYPTLQTAPNVNGQSFTSMGNITLSEGSTIDVSADAAGTVRILGGQLVMDNATISADTVNTNGAPVAIDINVTGDISLSTVDNPVLTARTTGSGDAGEIRISSQNMDVTATSLNNPIFSVIDTHTSGSGKAGDVNITVANNLTLTGDPFALVFAIDSGTSGLDGGQGGNVTLTAKNISLQSASIGTGRAVADNLFEDVSGSGGNLTITADSVKVATSSQLDTDGVGQAGDLTISAHDVHLTDFSFLSASGTAKGGAIRVSADQLIVDSSAFEADIVGPGSGGGITVTGKVVEFTNGSTITSQTFGNGNAGDIRITATDHLTLADDPSTGGAQTNPSGLFTNSFGNFGHLGNSGAISITTPRLNISGGARIESSTRSSGQGGAVSITADTISIDGERPTEPFSGFFVALGSARASGIFTRTVGSKFCTGPCGDAGNAFITTGTLNLTSGAQINSGTTSTGHGGDIVVNATGPITLSGTMIDGTPGGILSQAVGTVPGAGGGGNISLATSQSVSVTNGAVISASSTGSGNAGNITIQGLASPAQSVLIDGAGSGIFTDTQGTGAGGNITISANSVTLQNGATLSAATEGTAPTATGGTITIEATDVQLSNGASINAQTTGAGDAGAITITADGSVSLTTGSFITSSSLFGGNGGSVAITADENVSLTAGSFITSSSLFGGNGGSVAITAPTVSLQESNIFTSVQGLGSDFSTAVAGAVTINASRSLSLMHATINSSSSDTAGNAGRVFITSPTVSLSNNSAISSGTSALDAGLPTDGNAGPIELTVGQLVLADGSSITSQTAGGGQGGNITVHGLAGPGSQAADVTIASLSFMSTNASDIGSAGNITVDTARLTLVNGGSMQAATIGPGSGGTITIRAAEQVTISGEGLNCSACPVGQRTIPSQLLASSQSSAPAGNIVVGTPSLTLANGGQIVASASGAGPGGTVTVQGPQGAGSSATSFMASGQSTEGAASGIFTNTQGTGAGGNIVVNANTVTLQNGGTLSAATSGADPSATGGTIALNAGQVNLTTSGLITASTTGAGTGGSINIGTGTFASDASTVSSTATQASSGDITIAAGQSVTLNNGSLISSSTTGAGNAGNIMINAGQNFISNNSSVTTQASQASGGTIKITTTPSGMVELINSTISASVLDGTGGGGSVNIDPQFVILQNSQILAQAVRGPGGNISITTNLLLPDANSVISASSQSGVNGTVTVQSPNAPATGRIIPLSQKPLTATALLSQRCAALASGEFSSFTVAGRDSLPAEPGGWLASPLALATSSGGTGLEARGEGQGVVQGERREAGGDGETPILSLRQIAPPGFLTQAFAVDWSAGCTS